MADKDDQSLKATPPPSVGAAGPEVDGSAVGVAACRALESSRPDALYVDPYASALAQAARPTSTTTDVAEDPRFVMMSSYLAVRNRLFDGYLSTREPLGSGQWVLLGGGLDTRAYRLDFAPGTSVFELDRGATLQYKARVLAALGVAPVAHHVMVDIDLRDDWPSALLAQGFDADRPSYWVAEGLLAQLPAEAQDLLFARLDSLAAVGSRLVADSPGTDPARLRDSPDMRALMSRHRVAESSVSDERRSDPVDWLRGHGWSVDARRAGTAVREAGRHLGTALGDIMSDFVFVTAEKS